MNLHAVCLNCYIVIFKQFRQAAPHCSLSGSKTSIFGRCAL